MLSDVVQKILEYKIAYDPTGPAYDCGQATETSARRRRRTPQPTLHPAAQAAPPTKRRDDEGVWATRAIHTRRPTPRRGHNTCTVGTCSVLLRGGDDVLPEFPTLARPSLRCSRRHRSTAGVSVWATRHQTGPHEVVGRASAMPQTAPQRGRQLELVTSMALRSGRRGTREDPTR